MRFLRIAYRTNPARPFAVTNYRSYLLLTSGRGRRDVVTNRGLSTPRSPGDREMKNRSDVGLMAVTNRPSEAAARDLARSPRDRRAIAARSGPADNVRALVRSETDLLARAVEQ